MLSIIVVVGVVVGATKVVVVGSGIVSVVFSGVSFIGKPHPVRKLAANKKARQPEVICFI